MDHVNYHLIESALAPLTIENATLNGELNLDPDDEPRLRELFGNLVRPYVEQWSEKYRRKLQLSLAYYLNHPDVLGRILASQQDLDMPEPSDLVGFFQILWRCLFPAQDPRAMDLRRVQENNDVMEINLTHSP